MATEAISQDYDICSVVEEKEIAESVGSLAEKELINKGYSVRENQKYVVLDCIDFFLFAQLPVPGQLGGVSYVLVSKRGTILYIIVTG